MARNRVHIHATPEEVFGVLADPERYPDWVVGADKIRDYDEEFPAVGSRFHHKVGPGPVNIRDYSEVLEVDPPHRLVLKAKATNRIGQSQPSEPLWNPAGYMRNVVEKVEVTAV